MEDIANILRDRLGERAAKVPTRRLPSFMLRLGALFDPGLRDVTSMLGHRHAYSSAKAQRVFGWTPRPAAQTIADCANSLIAQGVA